MKIPAPIAFLLGGAAMACTAWAMTHNSSLIRVVDGDTVRLGDGGSSVRLVGFNAPERGDRAMCAAEHELGEKAKAALVYMIDSYKAELTLVPCACPPGTEGTKACNFGRRCGVLTIDGAAAADVMVKAGFAAPYHCGATSCPKLPRPWCGGEN